MTARPPEPAPLKHVRLWDPFLRVFHWALAILVCLAWYLGEFGPGIMTLHFYVGYAILGLLAFRLIWGVAGAWPARFGHFLYGPKTYLRYFSGLSKRSPSYWPGHNPLGALSVYLLLGVLAAQALSGLYTDPDDFINAGPLAAGAPAGWVPRATAIHQTLPVIILALVVLHLAAILFYRLWKGENLVPSMLHGRKIVRGEVPAERVIAIVEEPRP